MIHKEYIKKKNNQNENEKILFHGTDENNINLICQNGFNRSYCGKNGFLIHNLFLKTLAKFSNFYTKGVAYGQGVYFALNSAYSNGYVRNSTSLKKKMFRCKVLVGSCAIGNSAMKVPPNNISNGQQYDSTGDQGGSVFVCYHDNQCYPEYLISYH